LLASTSVLSAAEYFSRQFFPASKFARRFVIGGNVITRMTHRYLEDKAPDSETPSPRTKCPNKGYLRCEKQS
jgi:hypothetical protein